jgi:hypothetical protein
MDQMDESEAIDRQFAHTSGEADGSRDSPPPVASAVTADVMAAVDGLDDRQDAPLTEHIERYQQIHAGLQDALNGIEGV